MIRKVLYALAFTLSCMTGVGVARLLLAKIKNHQFNPQDVFVGHNPLMNFVIYFVVIFIVITFVIPSITPAHPISDEKLIK